MATIAIIDDDALMRMFFAKILRHGGFSVRAFDDGAAALAADLNGVDLVLTDLRMPTPGEQVIAELRARGEQMPIAVLSGDIAGKEQSLRALGVQAVLPKPVPRRRLYATLNHLLEAAACAA